jgi:hypothetical protein
VRFCPNYDCPYRLAHDRAAEYSGEAEKCSDCGAALADTLVATVKEAQDLGAPVGAPLELSPSPLGVVLPALLIAATVVIFFAMAAVGWFVYLGLGAMGIGMLRHRRYVTPRILPHEHGFVVVVGHERFAYPAARIESVRVGQRELRLGAWKLGTLHDLTLVAGGKSRMFTGFARDDSAPFVDFARALQARSTLR